MSKYLHFMTISAKQSLGNRANIIGSTILLFALVFIYNQLWVVIGRESSEYHLSTHFIWYLLMGEIIILTTTRSERQIGDDVKSGTMAYYLNKPVSFFAMRFFETVSSMSVLFFFMTVFGSAFVLFVVKQAPFEWYQFPIIMLGVYISCIISILLYIAIGYSALWIKDVNYFAMVVARLAFVLGGAIFPLTIYPDWFINIAKWTPFYSMYYLTIRLVYDFSWYNLGYALFLNFTWTAIISSFIFFAYQRLRSKVNIHGG
jgi:ABC-2 type transport system permease protein